MARHGAFRIKRIYDQPEPADGVRFLVDQFWPRGLKKNAARIDQWLKDVAPSDELRRWFGHDPGRRQAFRKRYFAELDAKPESWRSILEAAQSGPVTLVHAARDVEHNNAVALIEYLSHLPPKPARKPLARKGDRQP